MYTHVIVYIYAPSEEEGYIALHMLVGRFAALLVDQSLSK